MLKSEELLEGKKLSLTDKAPVVRSTFGFGYSILRQLTARSFFPAELTLLLALGLVAFFFED